MKNVSGAIFFKFDVIGQARDSQSHCWDLLVLQDLCLNISVWFDTSSEPVSDEVQRVRIRVGKDYAIQFLICC